jgi:AMP-binding enzyme
VPSTIVGSPFPAVAIPDVSLPALVLDDAAARATKPALIDGPSGRTITYGELADRVRLVAGGLAARGFQRGEVFAIYCPNLPEYAVAFYGVLLAGGTNTTINPLYTVEELSVQLNDAGAGYLLTVPPFLDKAVEAAGRSGVGEVFVLGEAAGAIPFAELLRAGRQPPGVIIGPHDLAVLAYSSGTTGLPKGIVLTHHNLVATLCQCRPVVDVREDDVGIAVLPFFHAYGLTVLMAFTLWRGATLVTMPRFDLVRRPADGPPAAVGTVSSVPARSWTARRTPPRETPASSSRPLSWRVFWPPARRLSRGHVPGWETVLGPVCGRSATTSGPRRKGERPTRRRWQCPEATSDEYPGWRVPLSGPDGEATVLEDVVRSERAFNLANVVREAIVGGRWHLAARQARIHVGRYDQSSFVQPSPPKT